VEQLLSGLDGHFVIPRVEQRAESSLSNSITPIPRLS
jgi:hypothetical protein